MKNNQDIIGRATAIDLPELGLAGVPAKIDTGADSSSIWVHEVTETADGLRVVFFGPTSPFYNGKAVVFNTYTLTRVANSFGKKELRFKVKLRIRVEGRLIRATFTLSNRASQTYPILLGRRLLKGKFLVDVTRGQALKAAETARKRKLVRDLEAMQRRKEES
jgi:hypothetical protein